MGKKIVTNNSLIVDAYSSECPVVFVEEMDVLSVLQKACTLVCDNHDLLSHPLSGSLKSNQTPFKTIVLDDETPTRPESIECIMKAIRAVEDFGIVSSPQTWPSNIIHDFKLIDKSFVDGGFYRQ
ncbi:MAG: GrdX family protein [Desulfovibrionales bacterium]|nr:GrdX family protein [Desulfovibrionales bacterium]